MELSVKFKTLGDLRRAMHVVRDMSDESAVTITRKAGEIFLTTNDDDVDDATKPD